MTSGTANSYQCGPHVFPSKSADEVVDSDADESFPEKRFESRRAIPLPRLRRLVSQEELFSLSSQESNASPHYISCGSSDDPCALDISERSGTELTGDAGISFGRESPMRCVSEFDKVAASDDESEKPICHAFNDRVVSSHDAPPLPNPLHSCSVLSAHIRALRIEAELHPLRVVLSRLMAHPTFNRKGLFNRPVDPVALRLPDYLTIVQKPMDLGTIKSRLHAIAYNRQDEVTEDIRLVFRNAMLYNPPGNPVHTAAQSMLDYFEELYATLVGYNESSKQQDLISEYVAIQCNLSQSPIQRISTSTGQGDSTPISPGLAVAYPKADKPTAAPFLCDVSEALQYPQTEAGSSTSIVNKEQATRSRPPTCASPKAKPIRRRRPSQLRALSHSCQACLGRVCAICNQGCLPLEPALLVCTGSNCAGTRIRKGATYYIAKDGSRQFCQRCYTNLAAVVQHSSCQDTIRHKSDLLKRKNEEEVAERWLTCGKCGCGVHQICAMFNDFVHSASDMLCPKCRFTGDCLALNKSAAHKELFDENELYTFMSGSDLPVALSSIVDRQSKCWDRMLSAEALQETAVSSFIQDRVRKKIQTSGCPNAERTVLVRIISDCNKEFLVPDVVCKHFRMESVDRNDRRTVPPPSKLSYHSQAIALFQKVDALDVCIFCMYVQEYDGDDTFDNNGVEVVPQRKRVYIAYLDSVEHFRPRSCRTMVYHEMLVSYLASARARGFETAHIWACPPSRGNSFVFWNHPSSQRTPTRERLEAWYHGALSRAIECGVVTDVQSLYESDFQRYLSELQNDGDKNLEKNGRMVCPPIFDGDFWIDEAVRIHSASIARNLKARLPCESPGGKGAPNEVEGDERCPAIQVATFLREKLISHPSSIAFRRPVNAAALKLHDYHKIIVKPMDLGTVYSRCLMGEYRHLRELVSDVKLVFSNAKQYNPKGHVIHNQAIELESFFTEELKSLIKSWNLKEVPGCQVEDICMSLDMRLESQSCSATVLADTKEDSSGDIVMSNADENKNSTGMSCTGEESSQSLIPYCDGPSRSKDTAILLFGGPDAIQQRMVGDDVWLLDKKNPAPPKNTSSSKKSCAKRKRPIHDPADEPPKQRRRQAWLGEEVGAAVRRMRTSFFACSLVPNENPSKEEKEKFDEYQNYVKLFSSRLKARSNDSVRLNLSHVADARHSLHEFSQFRNLEFDTLRRAKFSTAMLLYHLHNDRAPGLVPVCTSCNQDISEVRWHKVRKEGDRLRVYQAASPRGRGSAVEAEWNAEELCSECHAKHPKGDDFVPLQVSIKPRDS